MTAGLLTQPRFRKSSFLASGDVSKLKKQVSDLELKVSAQQKLIEILKSLPSDRARSASPEAKLDAAKKPKSALRARTKVKDRTSPDRGASREPENDGSGGASVNTDTTVMEAEGDPKLAASQTGTEAEGVTVQ